MSINAARPFTVTGRLECNFKPEDVNHPKYIAGLEVEIWQKSPMDVYFLGKGTTNEDGYYTVEFTVENDSPKMVEGELQDVFLKIYYQGILINGDNPYLPTPSISFNIDEEGDLLLQSNIE